MGCPWEKKSLGDVVHDQCMLSLGEGHIEEQRFFFFFLHNTYPSFIWVDPPPAIFPLSLVSMVGFKVKVK